MIIDSELESFQKRVIQFTKSKEITESFCKIVIKYCQRSSFFVNL